MLKVSEKLERVIKNLYIPNEFGVYADCSPTIDVLYDHLHKACPDIYLDIYNGVSKCVIVVAGEDVVIKIPFNGEFYANEVYNEENDCWEYPDEPIFEAFCCANYHYSLERNWDYCEAELFIYEQAKQDGMSELFPETAYYGMVHNHPIYLQERVFAFDELDSNEICSRYSPSKRAVEAYKTRKIENNDWLVHCAFDWAALLIDFYGEERVNELVTYANDVHATTDLHNGNIGYTLLGAPIILDFSGWYE